MRYQHVIQAVYHEPWLITPAAHASIRQLIDSHLARTAGEFRALREGTDICGQEVELEQMEVIDGIAHIPIGGVIGRKLSSFEKGSGAVDLDDVTEEIDQAMADQSVKMLLFDIDSPGGMYNGVPELAAKIAALDKPTYAFTAGEMCSAAYYLASSTDGIYATRSAGIGSIGVYTALLDTSEAVGRAGGRIEVFHNEGADYKGAGMPGVPLTQKQRAYIQDRVNEIGANFKAHVASMRGDIDEDTMRGQSFFGEEAVDLGLIDGLVNSKDELTTLLS